MDILRTEEIFVRQFADLRAEGVGVNAAYFLWGWLTRMDSGMIHVSLKGWTAAMDIGRKHGGNVRWWATANLVKDGQHQGSRKMQHKQNGHEIWGSNIRNGVKYSIIGSCSLVIPDTSSGAGYAVCVKGGYAFNNVPPTPASTQTIIQLSTTSESVE